MVLCSFSMTFLMHDTVRKLAWFAFGLVLGTFGLWFYAGHTRLISSLWYYGTSSYIDSGKGIALAACVPSDEAQVTDDNIFFLTCGGIY